jgi:hypothetical protein
MNQCPPGPQVFHWGRFEFFRKFAEIFANEYLSPLSKKKVFSGVSDTGEKFIAGRCRKSRVRLPFKRAMIKPMGYFG